MSARRSTSMTLALLCAVACGLLLCSASALAVRRHVLSGALGVPCVSEPCAPGQLKEPVGVAINEASGYVYVLDRAENRVERFSSAGAFEAQFDGSTTPAKAFAFGSGTPSYANGLIGGIAVDNSCYFKKLSVSACSAFDPSVGDVYVTDPGNGVVDKFGPEGAYIGQLQQESGGSAFTFTELEGVGVDANGTVWAYEAGQRLHGLADSFTKSTQSIFTSSSILANNGNLPSNFTSPGFTVDSEDTFYARGGESAAPAPSFVVSQFESSGKALEPFANEETSGVAVDLSNNEVFLDNVASVGVFSKGGSLRDRIGSGVLIGGSGLAVSHANESVYVADTTTALVDIFSPLPPSVPTVEGEGVSGVTGDSATLEAELNPEGVSTEYHFEYGSCASVAACKVTSFEKSVPVPDALVGSDFEVHGVSVSVQGLAAGTVYHFRVVTRNEKNAFGAAVKGEEHTFTTQTAGGSPLLPDGRSWELVSPANKYGAVLLPITREGPTQAAAGGDAMTYLAETPTESGAPGYAGTLQVLSTRGLDGWASRDISLPHESPTGVGIGQGSEYRSFSEDLALGAVQPFGSFTQASSPHALAPREASEQTAFLRANYLNSSVNDPCVTSCYRPLVTGAAGYANVPEGTIFGAGEQNGQCFILTCGPSFVGGSSDLSHVIVSSTVPLTKTPIESNVQAEALYEWSGSKLVLVSTLPGEPEEGGLASGASLGYPGGNVARHAVSSDGSRVVWTAHEQGIPHLYLRDTVRGETVKLDAVQGGSGIHESEPIFQTASSAGSRVFFTDRQRLTATSVGQGEGRDLYECEIVETAGKLECRLSDLTPPGSGEEASVGNQVLGASSDGSWVYFVAGGVLAHGAVGGSCTPRTLDATCNLYVWHDGTTKFVTRLANKDSPDWADEVTKQTARVSPDGEWLAFMSERELTGYDNHDALSGKLDEEVYLYSAGAEGGAGRVVCASCNPTGARPTGVEAGNLSLAGGDRAWEKGQWIAANIPGWTGYGGPTGNAVQAYQSRFLSDKGRLFFNSSDAIAPQDVNNTEDVYEFEPLGLGGCVSESVWFNAAADGCVQLVTSGSSAEESVFLDASETGGDVFFLTEAKLVSQDYDTALDVYDAHECTSASPCFAAPTVIPPPCGTGDSCKAGPSPQPTIFGSPASATFSGTGNLAPSGASKPAVKQRALARARKLARALRVCQRTKNHRRRVVCERQARTRFSGKVNATKKGRG